MDHKEMEVWKKSMDLVESVYDLTHNFPSDEKYGLTSQIRRAAVSIPSNISEGAARKGNKEFAQFIYIALGSLAELETQYLIAVRLDYISSKSEITDSLQQVKKLLLGTRNYLNKR